MTQLFTNQAKSTLAGAILAADVSLTLAAGEGSRFPVVTGSDFFLLTIQTSSAREDVKVTARAGDVCTIVRGQEDTSAQDWAAGASVRCHVTAGVMNTILAFVYNAALAAIGVLAPAANKMIYFTSGTVAALADLTAAGRALLDDADAAAQRTTLGLGTSATHASGDFAQTANNLSDVTAATARTNLGVYSTSETDTAITNALAGLAWKQPVRVATTSAKTLATDFENGDTIDGVVLATGNAVLIKNQATASENGIYYVNASGAPTRRTDADSGAELVNATVTVMEGTTNADTTWTCTTNSPITVNSTALAFAQVGASGASGTAGGDLTGTYPNPTIKNDVALGGNPTAATQSAGNNTTRLATTAFVQTALAAAGSGNGRWDPMALRAGQSASALDDDWSNTGTTLNARWTANAFWAPTSFDIDTTFPHHLWIKQNGSSGQVQSILQAIPAGDFVVQTVITVNPNNGNLSHAELLLGDNTTGTASLFGLMNYQDGSCRTAGQNGNAGGYAGNSGISSPYVSALNPVVVRIERASGSYTIEASADGVNGQRWALNPGSFGLSPAYFGLGFAAWSGDLRASFGTFRYSSTPTTRWGAYL